MEELEIVIEKEIDSEQLINILEEEIREIHPDYEQLTLTPSTEEQTKKGTFNKVTVLGDSNLVSENIKEGTSIFGVEGTAKTTSAKITDANHLFYKDARINYLEDFLSLCENVINTSYMFSECEKIKVLDLSSFNTSNVTDMYGMFLNCIYLTELDLSGWNTSNVTDMGGMFGAIKCTELDLSSFDMSNIKNISYAFSNCANIVNLRSFKNLGKGYTKKTANYSYYRLQLNSSYNLSHDSLLDIITNGLYDLNLTYDVANGGTLYRQSLVLGSTNLAKLTAEEIAIATNKGWDVT